ncbi:glutamate receptor ionotropic, kainate 2-like [Homarus americanus]
MWRLDGCGGLVVVVLAASRPQPSTTAGPVVLPTDHSDVTSAIDDVSFKVTHFHISPPNHLINTTSPTRTMQSALSTRKFPASLLLTVGARERETNLVTVGQYLTPLEKEETLATMLMTFVNTEFVNCSLVIVADGGYINSSAVYDLVHLPHAKQVVHLRKEEDLRGVVWEVPGCRGYVFLLHDPVPLLSFAVTSLSLWDYQGRYVVVGATLEQLEDLTRTAKGRKTEHIVGVIQSGREGEWLVYMNQLYWGTGMGLVTSWKRDNFTTRRSPFPDKTSDLRGAVLKVVTFEWEPSTLYYRQRNGSVHHLYGRDVEVVRALAPIFNFTIQFIEPPNGERWGMRQENGSWGGIVGLLGRGEADMAIANLFINTLLGRDQFQAYSTAFDTDQSCLMIRTEPPLPQWQSPSLPYTLETWLALLVGLILSGPVLCLLARAAVASTEAAGNESMVSLTVAYSDALRIHFQESQPRLPRRHSLRLLLGFLLIYAIILRIAYSSNLTAFLTVTRRPAGIQTLKQLYESPLLLFEASTFLKDSLLQSPNPYLRGLAERHVVVRDMTDIIREIIKGRGVFIQNRSAMEFLTNTLLASSSRAVGVRMVKECYAFFNVAVGLPTNSPLKSSLDRVIRWIFESGLVRLWKQESYSLKKKNKKELKGDGASESDTMEAIITSDMGQGGLVPLSLDHTQSIFYVLLFSYLLSALMFLGELTFARKM